ncbi:hypothetical protein ACIRBY_32230 [Streptomyces sp. NPDC096136]|uniref:hypothetical protein n=1 Tax=Streptomyces sp. NPDC096136 TaxID=3366076 RepID=UPI0038105C2C
MSRPASGRRGVANRRWRAARRWPQLRTVNPQSVGCGNHTLFVAGDHADAKQQDTDLLKSYGWTGILDLGPLVCARDMEMCAHMRSAIGFGLGPQFGNHFGIKVVR